MWAWLSALTWAATDTVPAGTNRSREQSQALPWLTLGVAALLVGLFVSGIPPEAGLDRAIPIAPWRWIGAHVLHVDLIHLGWNAAAWLLLAGWLEHHSRTALLWAFCAGVASVNAWFWWLSDLGAYVGLSGVLNTILVVLLAHLYASTPTTARWERYLLIAVFAGACVKAVIEWSAESSLVLSSDAWPAAPGAHLAGLSAGVLLAAWQKMTRA